VDANFADLTSLEIVLGRFLDPMDLRDHAQVAIIGEGVRRDLFGGDPPLGRYLKINDVWFEVIGILRGTGSGTSVQGVSVGSVDQEIYLPVTTALRKLDLDSLEAPLDEIVVQMAPDSNLREAAHRIGLLVDRLHGGADDYELVIPDALLEQSRRTQRLFTIVMGTIAGISLLVGGIGIMNIMLATVFERTREIGIRRAVGARRRDIQVLFLMESFTISLLGGVAGIVLGVVIAKVVAVSAGWPTVVTPLSVILSSGVSVAVGLTSGLYPALRAASLDPIDALRYE
jgi:putative ABC transport system permease protein